MRKEYELNKRSYDSVAISYANNAFSKQWMRSYVNDFADSIPPNATLLDLGCGPGNDSYLFSEKGIIVTGVDFSEEMIKEAKARVPKADFLVADISEVNFPKASFNAVWSVGALHHLDRDDLSKVMHKVFGWMKAGANAFISIKGGRGEGVENQLQIGAGTRSDKYWVYWQKDELEKLVEQIGFNVKKFTITEPERKADLPAGFEEVWLNVWLEK